MIHGLDHINIGTADIEGSVAFYENVLGLREGWHPPCDHPRVWLYAGDHPILHLEEDLEGDPTARNQYRHIAVKTTGYAETVAHLTSCGVSFEEFEVAATDVRQIFLNDPNGVTWELNFKAD